MNIPLIISIISFALCLVMFSFLRWYIKKRTSSDGILPEYRAEVNRLKADINAVTDRNLQLVEDRIKKLKDIMEEADKRVTVYAKELDKSRKGEALYTHLGRGIRAALKTPEEQAVINEERFELSSARPDLVPPAAPAQETRAPPAGLPREPAQKPTSKRRIREYIDNLANQGLPPEKIAEQLEISLAEVNLAMNLRRAKKT